MDNPLGVVISVVVSLLVLTGCTPQTLPKERLPEFSVISVQLPGFQPRQGEQISWYTDVFVAGDFPAEVKDWAAEETKARVEKGLESEGFTVSQARDSDYVLFAALIGGISEEPSGGQKEVLELIRLYPSLGGDEPYDRDMLVLAITTQEKVGDGKPLWKAAVEVYSTYDLGLPQAAKLQRLDAAINRLLATLPDVSYSY